VKRIISFFVSAMLLVSLSLGLTACQSTSTTLNVAAAASLTDALTEINNLYMQDNPNITILTNFASSGTLQTQIENGAPTDIFISAAAKQMDNLQSKGLIREETRQDLLNNKIVLIVPANSTLGLSSFSDLASDKVAKIAMGDPEFVPAGTYGEETLKLLGIYEEVQPKLILDSDVRWVLAHVESGDADAGIVYSTDAATSTKVKVVASAPDAINAEIVYPVAIIKSSTNVESAGHYIDFLFSNKARAVFEKYGFSLISK